MSCIIEACIDMYSITQAVFITPHRLRCSSQTPELVLTNLSKIKALLWHYLRLNSIFMVCFCIYQLFDVLSNWHNKHDFEQLAYDTIYITTAGIFLFCFKVWTSHETSVVYLTNQLFSLANVQPVISRGSIVNNLVLKYLVYSSSICVLIIVSFFPVFSIIHEFDPIQLYLGVLVPAKGHSEYLCLKFLSVAHYSVISFQTAATLYRLFLLILMLAICLNALTAKFLIEIVGPTRFRFRRSLRLFRQFQIINQLANIVMQEFVGALVGLGIVAASGSGFVVIAMYDELPILVYIVCSTPYFVSQVINFVLVYLGTKPMLNGMKYRAKWKALELQLDKKSRKELRSLPGQVGISLGCFVRNTKPHTSLSIADVIINFTWTAAVIKRQNNKILQANS